MAASPRSAARGIVARALRAAAFATALALLDGEASAARMVEDSLPRFGPEHGLSHNTITAIAEDHRGFLWLATAAALDRWDGLEVVSLRTPAAAPVTALFVDSRGQVWVGSGEGLFLADRDNRTLRREGLGALDEGVPIGALWEDEQGRIWVASGPRLWMSDRGRWREVAFEHPPDEDPRAAFTGLVGAGAGRVVAFLSELAPARSTLVVVDTETLEPRLEVLPAPWQSARLTLLEARGRVWLDPWRSFVVSDDGTVQFEQRGAAPAQLLANAPCQEREGRLWFATVRGYLLEDPATGELSEHLADQTATSWQANHLLGCTVDSTGAVWLGSLGGLYRHEPRGRPFRNYRHDPRDPTTIGGDPVSALVEDSLGRLWVGVYGGGIALFDPGGHFVRSRSDPRRPGSLCDDRVWSLGFAEPSSLWIGTESGLCHLDFVSGRFVAVEVPGLAREGTQARIKAIVVDSDGTLWLGSNFGLFRYHPRTGEGRRVGLQPSDGTLASRQVGDLLLHGSTLWVASTDGDLQQLHISSGALATSRLRLADGRAVERTAIYSLARDDAGAVWAGTHVGLARFDRDRSSLQVVVGAPELLGPIVYSVVRLANGDLWLGTNRGLVRLADIDAGAPRVRRFDLADGVGSLEWNRHAALLRRDGTLAFGGMTGLTLFDPAAVVPDPVAPRVALTAVRVLGDEGEREVPLAGLETLELSPHDHAVSVELAGLAFAQPAKHRYEYRLEGYEHDWVAAGNRRVARYTNLRPGRYRLLARAANADGLWSEAGETLAIVVRPPYWATWWFRSVLLVGIVAGLALAHQLRVRHFLALERMRLRIASDLHDELGSEVSAIALVASMLAQEPRLEAPARARLREVQGAAQRVGQGLRDLVWTINPEQDRVGALADRMRSIAETLLAQQDVDFVFELGDPQQALPMERRRQLLLAYKELVHNVTRHAAARHVLIRLRTQGERVELEVTDDGGGFDPSAPTDGNGLASLRRRAQALGVTLEIDSRPGRGTRVRLA